jgi:tRNA (guanine-N7-)-methyltransferase
MSKGKLAKFADLKTFPNVFEELPLPKGRWAERFGNNNRIVLELACGKAEYTINLALRHPDRNFIGIDLKGARIWRGAKTAAEMDIYNVAFIRNRIELLTEFFGKDEISEIWINFPDPFPKPCKSQKRLTSARFLALYRRVLKKDGLIHLKTDSDGLFQFTLETIADEKGHIHGLTWNLYGSPIENQDLAIQTTFEKGHLLAKRTIKYVCFSLAR